MAVDVAFWRGRSVFLTGHTGFKGSWLALWLQALGARVTGYALAPPTEPSLFVQAGVAGGMDSIIGDIRDYDALHATLRASGAEVVFHLAAQALVAEGYRAPRDTFGANLTGTVNLLDAMRDCPTVKAAVIVTSDKCYAPAAGAAWHTEDDPLGGNDPYSASKACAEIAAASWRASYFETPRGPLLATARAGNVIGGGDWAAHRLLPDIVRAFGADRPAVLRMPHAVRPWQHVLEPLAGYLLLSQRLAAGDARCAAAWNFGPAAEDHIDVATVAGQCTRLWGDGASVATEPVDFPHESPVLRLDASRARRELGWQPRWRAAAALQQTLVWYREQAAGGDARTLTLAQIRDHQAKGASA
jgi:CDP-glucose 4,6-dehydratase